MEQILSDTYTFTLSNEVLRVFDNAKAMLFPAIRLDKPPWCVQAHPIEQKLLTLCYGGAGIDVWDLHSASLLFSVNTREAPNEFIMSNSGRYVVIRACWDAISSSGTCLYLVDLQRKKSDIAPYTIVAIPFEYPYEFDPKIYFSDDEQFLYLIWDDEFEQQSDVVNVCYHLPNEELDSLGEQKVSHERLPTKPYHPNYYPQDLVSNLSELAILKNGQYFY
ncbi:hypothetical protein [Pseudoalteromonas sp. A25]|uniref:hypothetical protein n=1 Tax=Pseudoalteromonas sp. A25 TaxID=116092 RepID=UPI001260F635|nr:hypothetical protein [Pseudoalteromonas sp. A25]